MTQTKHTIQLWDVDKLVPYATNAKKHPPEQIKKLAQAIKKFGWTQPIVVWTNGEIIAGHGRRLAAIELGQAKVPVIVRDDLSQPEADALRLADNQVTSTQYDQAAIQEELRRLSEELIGSDIDLTDLGFDAKELDFSLADLGEINSDYFADDIGAAVEEQKTKNEEAIERADDTAAPIGDALGFKRVTVAQSRELRELVSRVESVTALTGPEALIAILKRGLEAK